MDAKEERMSVFAIMVYGIGWFVLGAYAGYVYKGME
jgi:hypothetical protein